MTKQTLAWAVDQLALRKRVVMASVSNPGSVPGKVGARLAVAERKLNSMGPSAEQVLS